MTDPGALVLLGLLGLANVLLWRILQVLRRLRP